MSKMPGEIVLEEWTPKMNPEMFTGQKGCPVKIESVMVYFSMEEYAGNAPRHKVRRTTYEDGSTFFVCGEVPTATEVFGTLCELQDRRSGMVSEFSVAGPSGEIRDCSTDSDSPEYWRVSEQKNSLCAGARI